LTTGALRERDSASTASRTFRSPSGPDLPTIRRPAIPAMRSSSASTSARWRSWVST
jgi:hypothetical protein